MNGNLEFKPIRTRFYPGPYSSLEFGTDYHVGIHYFSNSNRRAAIDAACYLQNYYGGDLSRTKLRYQINREKGIFREWWEWADHLVPLYPVSIFNTYCRKDIAPNSDSLDGFMISFNLSHFFMDEILIIKPNFSHVFIDCLIAACRYRRIPVFYLEKIDNSFCKKEITTVNEEYISLMDKTVTEDFEWDEKHTHIYLTMNNDNYDYPENGNYYTEGHEEYNIPIVPLQLLKRFDEWHRLSVRLSNEIKENEYKWLAGALGYFLKGKCEVTTEDGEYGTELFDLEKD